MTLSNFPQEFYKLSLKNNAKMVSKNIYKIIKIKLKTKNCHPNFLSRYLNENNISDEEMRSQASFASFSSDGKDFTIQYCLKD